MSIQQRLHTKLVQKLILTPSLQQAIKLLPMSTLELSDLLNQEMVENPLLEEVPTEELQPAEQQQAEKAEADKPVTEKSDTWDDADYEYFFGDYLDDGYRSRTPSEVKELPRSRTRCRRRARSRTTWSGNSRCRRATTSSARSAGRSSATSTTTATSSPRSRRSRRWGSGRVADVERALQHVQTFDPIGVAARDLQECLIAADSPHRARGHAGGEDRHRAPAPAAEPSGTGNRSQARDEHRGPEGTHRDHPQSRSEARQPLQPDAVAVRHP